MDPKKWIGLKAAAADLDPKRSPRFLAREVRAGRLRAARLGGRGEFVTCQAWIDSWIEASAQPVFEKRRA